MTREPIISLHVPKAAGSSLRRHLHEIFQDGLYLHYRKNKVVNGEVTWVPPKKEDFKINKNPVCIHGHFRQSDKTSTDYYYPDINQFSLLLRDPLSMQISNYFYLKEEEKRDNGKRLKVTSINDYLLKSKSFIFDNLPKIARNNYKKFIQEQCLVIGISENFDVFIEDLYSLYNKKPVIEKIRVNTSNKDEVIDHEIAKSWKERHDKEYELYNYIIYLLKNNFNATQKNKFYYKK